MKQKWETSLFFWLCFGLWFFFFLVSRWQSQKGQSGIKMERVSVVWLAAALVLALAGIKKGDNKKD